MSIAAAALATALTFSPVNATPPPTYFLGGTDFAVHVVQRMRGRVERDRRTVGEGRGVDLFAEIVDAQVGGRGEPVGAPGRLPEHRVQGAGQLIEHRG